MYNFMTPNVRKLIDLSLFISKIKLIFTRAGVSDFREGQVKNRVKSGKCYIFRGFEKDFPICPWLVGTSLFHHSDSKYPLNLTLIGQGFLTSLGLGGGGRHPSLSSLFVALSQQNFVLRLTIKALAEIWKNLHKINDVIDNDVIIVRKLVEKTVTTA